MNSRSDKIFAIGISVTLVLLLGATIVMSFDFWRDIPGLLDPAAVTPMLLGITFSLIVAMLIIGVYFYGRRQEIRDGAAKPDRTDPPINP